MLAMYAGGRRAAHRRGVLMNPVFNSRAVQRKLRTEEETEYTAHDAIRAAAADVTMPVADNGAGPDRNPFDKR